MPWLNAAIPAKIARGIGAAASHIGIPAVGNFAAIGVGPGHCPTIYRGTAAIANAYGRSEALIPLIANEVSAISRSAHRT